MWIKGNHYKYLPYVSLFMVNIQERVIMEHIRYVIIDISIQILQSSKTWHYIYS